MTGFVDRYKGRRHPAVQAYLCCETTMESSSLRNQSRRFEVAVYDCELHVRFTMIEEKGALTDRERLLEILLDALSCGDDEYLESHEIQVRAEEVSETSASASLRRQIIRLRNSEKFI